jgi:TetR/AcrR family transcriptional repressor of nem operon
MKPAISRHTQTDTKSLILAQALELLLTRSYVGLSFQELADRVGIRKASLYHHFDSKESLGVALIDEAQTRFTQWTQRLAGQSAPQKIAAYILMFRNLVGAGHRVCPIGATAGEWDCLEPALQAAVRRLLDRHLDWLTDAVAQWNLPPNSEAAAADVLARQRAMQINALLQGAMLSARIQSDIAVFDAAIAPLSASLQSLH